MHGVDFQRASSLKTLNHFSGLFEFLTSVLMSVEAAHDFHLFTANFMLVFQTFQLSYVP